MTGPGQTRPVPGEPVPGGSLRTGSLRRRVTWSSIAVLVAALLLVLVLTELAFGTQSRRELRSRIADRVQLAEQLSQAGVPPPELFRRLQAPDVAIRLVAPDGTVYGQLPVGPPHHGPGGPGAPGGLGNANPGNGDPGNIGPGDPVLQRTLPDDSQLTLAGDIDSISAAQRRLRRVLLLVGVLAVAVAAVVLLASTRLALAPLDTMTALAHSIARGDRGRRLSPARTDTELGRTAAAFDNMLDALEGTEQQARSSEARALASEARALASEARAVASEAQTRQFVADAAHELRTPLAGVRAAAEASMSADLPEPDRQRLQGLLIREAGRAGRLVEDLLALARLDAGQQPRREPVELRELARAEAERVRLLSPGLDLRVDGEPVTVSADAQQISQVLANLLDNARRYATQRIDVRVAADGDGVVITVTDDGPGIAEADRERIFDRLVRLDEARTRPDGAGTSNGPSGAGLGLAIARSIARAHGGDLRCVAPTSTPTPGLGTTGAVFRLELPAQ